MAIMEINYFQEPGLLVPIILFISFMTVTKSSLKLIFLIVKYNYMAYIFIQK